jgi:hypothetical protein
VIFLWITANDASVGNKDKDYRSHRSGEMLKNPAFRSRNISLEDVNKTIWDRYKKALRKRGPRSEHVTDVGIPATTTWFPLEMTFKLKIMRTLLITI